MFRNYGISPDTGTRVAPLGLEQAFSRGAFIRVPVLQGDNLNEERLEEPLTPEPTKSTPLTDFSREHLCRLWEPIISAE